MNALRVDEVKESESFKREFVIRSLLNSKLHIRNSSELNVFVVVVVVFSSNFARRSFAIYLSREQF